MCPARKSRQRRASTSATLTTVSVSCFRFCFTFGSTFHSADLDRRIVLPAKWSHLSEKARINYSRVASTLRQMQAIQNGQSVDFVEPEEAVCRNCSVALNWQAGDTILRPYFDRLKSSSRINIVYDGRCRRCRNADCARPYGARKPKGVAVSGLPAIRDRATGQIVADTQARRDGKRPLPPGTSHPILDGIEKGARRGAVTDFLLHVVKKGSAPCNLLGLIRLEESVREKTFQALTKHEIRCTLCTRVLSMNTLDGYVMVSRLVARTVEFEQGLTNVLPPQMSFDRTCYDEQGSYYQYGDPRQILQLTCWGCNT